MVCIESGKIIEFHDEIIEERQSEIASKYGYEIVDHNMVLYVKKIKS
jgi:Fur family ferric uptake transcriptional regulator